MKYLRKIIAGILCAALFFQLPCAGAQGMDIVRAEGGEEGPQVQIIREDRGDMEPLIAVEITDDEMDKIRQETNMAQSWYGAGDSLEESFLDCGSDYGYQDMTKRSSGSNRQYLYREMEEVSRAFTLGQAEASVIELEDDVCYAAGAIDLSGYPLSREEKIESYFMFRNDNPQYFWLSNMVVYSTNGLIVLTYDAYRDGTARNAAFKEILDTMEQVYTAGIEEGDSRYQKVLKIHDALIADIEYSEDMYEETAHSIAGAMTSARSAVCEGYAKVMQLMMNYYDICNIYVTGAAGEPHAWNMVQMGDGQYYWLDATWDDQEQYILQHEYFLVGNENFTDHTADGPWGVGTDFLYELPAASDTDYHAPLEAIVPDRTQIYASPGATGVIGYTLEPEDTTEDVEVLFSSSAPEIVEVNALTGEWTALQTGTATITLTGSGGVTAQCVITVGDIVRGDVDGSGITDISDLRLVLRFVCRKTEFNSIQMQAGDVTDDGGVDIQDLRRILRFICRKIEVL